MNACIARSKYRSGLNTVQVGITAQAAAAVRQELRVNASEVQLQREAYEATCVEKLLRERLLRVGAHCTHRI